MKLSSLLDPRLVKCGLAAQTKDEALSEVIQLMVDGTPGLTPAELRASLAEREKLGPFSMAKGSAFPHARTEKITDFRIAVGTAPRGIDFKAPDGNPIRVIVLFAIPKKHSNLYLHTLAQFLNLFNLEENLLRAAQARTPEELIQAIDAVAGRPAGAVPATSIPSVTGSTTLARAMELFSTHRVETLPVTDAEGHLVGELSASAILQLGLREHLLHVADTASLKPADPVETVLRTHSGSALESLGVIAANGFRTVQEEEPLLEMAIKLSQPGCRGAYVLRGRKLAGFLTTSDLLKRMAGGK